MRFVLIMLALFLLVFVGLFVYGLTVKPETRTIEQDAVGVPNS